MLGRLLIPLIPAALVPLWAKPGLTEKSVRSVPFFFVCQIFACIPI